MREETDNAVRVNIERILFESKELLSIHDTSGLQLQTANAGSML